MDQFCLPTTKLPPIRSLHECSGDVLRNSLVYLRQIYSPEVRGSRRRKNSSAEGSLQADTFERAYAIRWLTTLISDPDVAEDVLEDASSLLAVCAGTSAAGVIHRTFIFPSKSDEIRVQVRDIPLENQDFHSVGSQTWGGACVLAEAIVEDPSLFGLTSSKPLRVLELGAGTGLVSLAVGILWKSYPDNDRQLQLVATDFYSSVLTNLQANIEANFPPQNCLDSVSISHQFLDWSKFPDIVSPSTPFDEPFDLVLGADIVYETQHAVWIKSCLSTLLRKPKPDDHIPPTFHLVIPLRFTHSAESGTVDTVFDASSSDTLVIFSKETILCDAGSGREGEVVEYSYYQIRWPPTSS
ncbi:putative methyltransferase-domain-containing protein [Mycena floridula]|nr:putative methyltransferase-domain-containing protein [Mycena floridula]